MIRTTTAFAVVCACTVAHAGFTTIDFSTDDSGAVLVNGQDIASPDEFGAIFSVSSSGPNLGATIFDSDPMGPNMGGPDPDLLVGLGNILMLQSTSSPTQTVPGVFDTPNDSSAGGSIRFDFNDPMRMLSVDLIDMNGGNGMTVTLMDTMGLSRVYTVPERWTNDVTNAPLGWDTLDLTVLSPQDGEGAGGSATVGQDMGFNEFSVISVEFDLVGSGGIDNFTFVPSPGAAALLGIAGLAMARRRR